MSDQLSIAALACTLALAALCLHAPAIAEQSSGAGAGWLKATAGIDWPAIAPFR